MPTIVTAATMVMRMHASTASAATTSAPLNAMPVEAAVANIEIRGPNVRKPRAGTEALGTNVAALGTGREEKGANTEALAAGTELPGAIIEPLGAGDKVPGANAVTPGIWACVATPVHLTAGMSSVAMPEEGVLTLAWGDARALAGDFNGVFADAGVRLNVVQGGTLLCLFDRPMDVATHDPERVAGHDVFGFQPAGADAPRLRRLMSEMEMWLFDHEINRRRAARAEPAVTGLWLWGGGAIGEPPAVSIWAAGRDPLFAAFGDEPAMPSDGRSGVVVCDDHPGTSTWPAVEQRWLMPALEALRAGRIRRIYLSAARRRFDLAAGPRWRFWRRPRPWWESFELTSGG